MKFNFDEIVDRRATYSVKYDLLKDLYGREDITPLWVADMEFKSPQCITEALAKVVDSGVYGYSVEPYELKESIREWLLKEQGWSVSREWMSFIPGIVRGIGFVINYFTEPGDKIIVQSPVYHPFTNVPIGNGREVIRNILSRGDDSQPLKQNFDNLLSLIEENEATDRPIKVLILCNPHNPAGVIWSREELIRLAEICYDHNILVVSDEIHADLTLWGNKHIPFASVSEKAAMNSITFGAPSKTFNIPGLASSFAVVPNLEIANGFFEWLHVNELNSPPITASVATIAAYKDGLEWRDEVISYIESNIKYIQQKCFQFTDKDGNTLIDVVVPQSSYLVWLDCTKLLRKLVCREFLQLEDQKVLVDYFVNRVGIALNDGTTYGVEGLGFMRLNVACPRRMLEFKFV